MWTEILDIFINKHFIFDCRKIGPWHNSRTQKTAALITALFNWNYIGCSGILGWDKYLHHSCRDDHTIYHWRDALGCAFMKNVSTYLIQLFIPRTVCVYRRHYIPGRSNFVFNQICLMCVTVRSYIAGAAVWVYIWPNNLQEYRVPLLSIYL